jgi:hypothetical protein
MERRCLLAVLILCSTVVYGCSAVPIPDVPQPKLTPDDLEVFAAVINDTIREPREEGRERLKRLGFDVPILVGDETLQTCEVYDHTTWRCVDPKLMTCLSAYPVALQDRSRRSYSISSAFAPDILLVDSDYYYSLLRQPGAGRLLDGLQRRYTPNLKVVDVAYFTAPLYPRPREALVLMRHYFNGASCLLLRLNADGWNVERALGGWQE